MAQFGIVGFDGIGLAFTFRDFVATPVIPQPVVSLESITEIMFGLGCLIDQGLAGWLRAFPDHVPAQMAAGLPVDQRQDVDP